MRRSRIAYANEKVKKDVKKSPGSTGNKGGRKTKVSEDALKKSSANICAKLNLNVVELDYSEAEYQDAKSYKLFGAHIRPFILKDNPEISMTMMMTLIAAKWHEFKDSVYFKGDVNLVKTPQSLNLEDISEGEKGSKIRGRKRKIQSPDEAALEYEKKRLQNIAERMSFLESLNIHEAKENYVGTAQRGLKSSNKERVKWGTKEKEILPLRSPSMRLRKLDPAGEPLPDEVPTQKILSYEELHSEAVPKQDYVDCVEHIFQVKVPSQVQLNTMYLQVMSESSSKPIVLKRKMMNFEKMLISTSLALDIVNNSEFNMFVKTLDPLFQMPAIQTLEMDFKKHYKLVKSRIRNLLKEATIIVTSFHLWVSKSRVTYFSVNAHYLTKEWNYEHRLLMLKRIFGIPNKTTLVYEYKLILQKFGIDNLVFLNLTSNKSNVFNSFPFIFRAIEVNDVKMAAMNDLTLNRYNYTFDEFIDIEKLLNIETFEVNSIANRNENFIYTLLSIIKESIENIPALIQTLQNCHKILALIFLSDLPNELASLLKHCIDARPNSAILMFQRFYEVYKKLSSILQQTSHNSLLLTQIQLEILEEFIEVLQPFQESIDFFFNHSPASISRCLPIVIALRHHLELLATVHLKILIETLISNLEERFQGIYEDPIYVISTILHPAWKLAPFIHIDMKTKAKEIILNELHKISDNSLHSSKVANKSGTLSKNSRLSLMFAVCKSNTQILPGYEIELESYLKDIQIEEDSNPLDFWKLNEPKYPNLSVLSRMYLAVPAISLPIEKLRNLTKDIINDCSNLINRCLFSEMAVLKYNLDLF